MITAMSQQIYPDNIGQEYNPTMIQRATTQYCVVLDPDFQRDNPVEAKHRRLVRSHRNGPLDRDLKPNPNIRDELNVQYNHCQLFFFTNYKCRVSCLIHLRKH